jgi:hypothetical protein
VFAGEALVRLRDQEARARLATAEVQIALHRRARTDENPNARAAARRRAEDAVWDAERAIVEARTTLDRVAPRSSGALAAARMRMNASAVAPAGLAALRTVEQYVESSGLRPKLILLVKIGVSQINGCAYCLHMHSA